MKEEHIVIVLTGAILLFILLSMGIILFTFVYSRRIREQQVLLRENERKQQLDLLSVTMSAQEKERQRIGADIHDDIGPMLATSKLLLKQFRYLEDEAEINNHIDRLGRNLDEIISRIRVVSRNLNPQVLRDFGLIAAIEDICSLITDSNELNVHFKMSKVLPKLSIFEELTLYRIVQECCTNTIKHGGAKNLYIKLKYQNNNLQLEMHDDGRGIDMVQLKASGGLGIKNIRARAKAIHADVNISNINSGASIKINLESKT